MRFCHQKKEQVTNNQYQVDSLCELKFNFPKRFIRKLLNLEYVSKKTKKINKKTGQNDIEIERRLTL